MNSIKQVLEADGVPSFHFGWTGEQEQEKPAEYYTFQMVARTPALIADDQTKEETETYLVKLFSNGDYETLLDTTVSNLRKADCAVMKVGQEAYESETGYYVIPITVQMLKE